MLALEHDPAVDVTIFYNDIRTSGKGFEELYLRAQAAGIRFVKALPGRITPDARSRAVIAYESLETGRQERLTVDLVVLAVGLEGAKTPPPFLDQSLEQDDQGFFKARHPIMHPVESSRPGVFLAGTCLGPRDIAETVCQASGAAGRVVRLLAELREKDSA
jgi:heterodisulfide reductase subunit A